MALTDKSLFLYGLEVNDSSRFIDFRVVALEVPRLATLRLGFYSLQSLTEEIKRALEVAAPLETFTMGIDRNILGGLENRITITKDGGGNFELLFGSGASVPNTIAPIIGFAQGVDRTGASAYTGVDTAGIALVPDRIGYQFLDQEHMSENFGSINISASGQKEAIIYSIQGFWQVQFKYITQTKWKTEWNPLMLWMIKMRGVEFTPEISSPNEVLDGTLEKNNSSGKGLKFRAIEMLPNFPFNYDTGVMTFRVRPETVLFV